MKTRKLIILMADDDLEDRILVREAFEGKPVGLQYVGDGQELLDYLLCRGKFADAGAYPRPDLILLDLNMPKVSGTDALARIKADSCLRSIPVVVLTTSQLECEVQKCYELGANSYMVKPMSFENLVGMMESLHLYWSDIAKLPAHQIPPSCS